MLLCICKVHKTVIHFCFSSELVVLSWSDEIYKKKHKKDIHPKMANEWIQILECKLLDLHGFQILYQTSEIIKQTIHFIDGLNISNYIDTRIDRQNKTQALFKQLKVKTNRTSFYVEIVTDITLWNSENIYTK